MFSSTFHARRGKATLHVPLVKAELSVTMFLLHDVFGSCSLRVGECAKFVCCLCVGYHLCYV